MSVTFDVQKIWKGEIPQKYTVKVSAPCEREYINQNDPQFFNSYDVSKYIQEDRYYIIVGVLSGGYLKPDSYICGVGSIEINDVLLDQIINKGVPPYNSKDDSFGLGQPIKIYR